MDADLLVIDRYAKGVADLNLKVNTTVALSEPCESIWHKPFDFDAHFLLYSLSPTTPTPRLLKTGPVVGQLKMQGYSVYQNFVAIDIDNPKHAPWTPETIPLWKKTLEQVGTDVILSNYYAAYTTARGGRLVYKLAEPVLVPLGEFVTRYLVGRLLDQLDIQADTIYDWTRLYRLPNVTRDYKQTATSPFYQLLTPQKLLSEHKLIEHGYNSVEVARFLPENHVRRIASVTLPDNTPRPSPLEAKEEIEHYGPTGRLVLTSQYKHIKKELRKYALTNRYVLNLETIQEGYRNSTLTKVVGSALKATAKEEYITPTLLYAVLTPMIERWDDDEAGDWHDILWSLILRFWKIEQSKAQVQEQIDQEKAVEAANSAGSIYEGLKRWSNHPISSILRKSDPNDEHVIRAIRDIALIALGNVYYVLGKDGKYDSTHITGVDKITPHIRNLGVEGIIPVTDDRGNFLDSSQIVKSGLTIVNEAVYSMDAEQHGTLIKTGSKTVLHQQINSRRDDLKPTFDLDVDEWLRQLFTGRDYMQAMKWIGYALDFEGGAICALSINGDAGCGKAMLMEGLAECLESPCYCTSSEMTDRFNGMLAKTPFVSVNEGWKSSNNVEIAAAFKDLVGGSRQLVEIKNGPKVTVHNPVRVVMTANDREVIRSLGGRGDVSIETYHALCERVLHFDVGDKASQWLRDKGGRRFTGADGRRWILGDTGQQSDYVVAKHFLWLYEHRREFGAPGKRFLVMGNLHNTEHSIALMLGPAMSETISIICDRLKNNTLPRGMYIVNDCDVFITVNSIISAISLKKECTRLANFHTIDSLLSRIGEIHADKDGNTVYKLRLDHVYRVARSVGVANRALKEITDLYLERQMTC